LNISPTFLWIVLGWEGFHFLWTFGVMKGTKPTEDQYGKRIFLCVLIGAIHVAIAMYVLVQLLN
jgi:hypothetical protein